MNEEERLQKDKEWVKSTESQAALNEARRQAKKAINEIMKPNIPIRLMSMECTCCPIHKKS